MLLPLFFVVLFLTFYGPNDDLALVENGSRSASGAELKSALLLNFSFIAFKIFTG